MLKLRLATALVLAPAALAGVFFLPNHLFALFFFVVAVFGLYEWAGLAGLARPRAKIVYVLLAGACMGALWLGPQWRMAALVATSVFWLIACGFVLRWAMGRGHAWVATPETSRTTALPRPIWFAVGGVLALSGAWLGLVWLHALDPWRVVWAFALAWTVDSAAYFAGQALGSAKLAPRVSPAKTWEGVAGGICGGFAVGLGLAWALDFGSLWAWSVVAVAMSVVAVFGDLFESAIKRASGAKDSGTLLPGHGGVLDRIDSTIAVLPVFALWSAVMM